MKSIYILDDHILDNSDMLKDTWKKNPTMPISNKVGFKYIKPISAMYENPPYARIDTVSEQL